MAKAPRLRRTESVGTLRKDLKIMTVNVPDRSTGKINEFARLVCQTSEEYLLEIIEERIDHDCAYNETAHLAKSEIDKKRLDDRRIAKRINALIKDILRNPFDGTGKPEPLKFNHFHSTAYFSH